MAVTTAWTDPSVAASSSGLDLGTGGILTETVYDRILSDLYRIGGADGNTKSGPLSFTNGTLTNTTLSAPTIGGPAQIDCNAGALQLPRGALVAPTDEGSIAWDTDDDLLKVGTGAATKTMVDTNSTQTISGKTFTSPIINTPSSSGHVYSGTYTPTLTGVSSYSSGTAYQCQYMRVGNVVTVSGFVDITPSGAGTVGWRVSLPIASNFPNTKVCAGTAASWTDGDKSGFIYADTVNDEAYVAYNSAAGTSTSVMFIFSYLIG